MVRATKGGPVSGGKHYAEYSGLSTDDKPTESVMTGSLFLEIDTGDVYAFDEEGAAGSEWLKICALGGSGS